VAEEVPERNAGFKKEGLGFVATVCVDEVEYPPDEVGCKRDLECESLRGAASIVRTEGLQDEVETSAAEKSCRG